MSRSFWLRGMWKPSDGPTTVKRAHKRTATCLEEEE